MSARVCVGAVAGAYGVRGEVRLKSFCADPDDIATYGALVTEDGTRSFDVRLMGQIKNGFAARLTGIGTKEQADALKGVRLYVDRDRLPEPEEDEYYHADLIGMVVADTGGTVLGRVRAVLNHGAGDLLEITGPDLKTPVLLPFTKEAVPTVDLTGRRLVADPPDGVFWDD
ncbi:MAG: ribosome maturation factor RimM [Pseudomonadota bacterium]